MSPTLFGQDTPPPTSYPTRLRQASAEDAVHVHPSSLPLFCTEMLWVDIPLALARGDLTHAKACWDQRTPEARANPDWWETWLRWGMVDDAAPCVFQQGCHWLLHDLDLRLVNPEGGFTPVHRDLFGQRGSIWSVLPSSSVQHHILDTLVPWLLSENIPLASSTMVEALDYLADQRNHVQKTSQPWLPLLEQPWIVALWQAGHTISAVTLSHLDPEFKQALQAHQERWMLEGALPAAAAVIPRKVRL